MRYIFIEIIQNDYRSDEKYIVTSHFQHRTRCYATIKLQITMSWLKPQGNLRSKVFRV